MNSYSINRGSDRIISIYFREMLGGEWAPFSPSSISSSLQVTLSEAYGSNKRIMPFRIAGDAVEVELNGENQKIGTYYVDVSFIRPSSDMNDGTESVSLRVGEITVVGVDDGSGNFTGSVYLRDVDAIELVAELREKVRTLESTVSAVRAEKEAVSRELATTKTNLQEAQQNLSEVNAEVERKKRDVKEAQDKVVECQQAIREKDAEIEQLKEELRQAQDSNEDERIRQLQEQIGILQEEKQTLTEEKEQLQSKVTQLASSLREVEILMNEAIQAKEKAEADLAHVVENIKDGKTPQISIGDVTEGETNATLTPDGEDKHGNPRLKLNLTLARGRDGQMPTIGIGTVSTVDSTQSASVTIRKNGDDGYLLDISIPRGTNGSDAPIDINTVTVSFEEAEIEEELSSGETFPVLFGKIKKFFSGLSEKFAPRNHNHDNVYSKTDHNHNDVYAPKTHTHNMYALASHSHDILDFFDGVNSTTSLSNLPTTKQVVSVTLERPSTLSINGTLSEGRHLLVGITPANDFTLPIPNSGSFVSMDGASVSCKAGQRVELSILRVSGKNIIKVSTSK